MSDARPIGDQLLDAERLNRRGLVIAGCALLWLGTVAIGSLSLVPEMLAPLALILAAIIGAKVRSTRLLRARLERIASECTRADQVPSLIAAVDKGSALVGALATPHLIRLLPKVRELHAPSFGVQHQRWLCAQLQAAIRRGDGGPDPSLVVAVIHAVREVGEAGAVPLVERLCAPDDPDDFRDAAMACLPVLVERVAKARDSSTLLRPSSADEQTLLRPAPGSTAAPDEHLLRPTDGE